MQSILLLALLTTTPAYQDYAPPDKVSPLPLGSTRPADDETISLVYRTFGENLGVFLGTDPRCYWKLLQEECSRTWAAFSWQGVGLAHEVYLGRGVALWVEARTMGFWGTGRVGLIWYPTEGCRLPVGFDLVNQRLYGPSREEVAVPAIFLGRALPFLLGAWTRKP